MTYLGFSPDRADRIHDQLDRDLSAVEHWMERIERAVPYSGATTLRLAEAVETVREVDLHGTVDGRTQVVV